jgi:signal transduction histidine kinase
MRFQRAVLKLISSSQFMVTAVMLLLLPLLAYLQYHWLGQLSASKSEQMKTHLQLVATRFSQDFDQEIARTYAAFVLSQDMRTDDRLSDYAACYQRWSKSSSYPGLVKAVFLALSDERRRLTLSALDRQALKFETSEWPQAMAALHRQLEEQVSNPLAFAPSAIGRAEPHPRVLQIINEGLPALVLALVDTPVRLRNDSSFTPPQLVGFAIVELDLPFIQQEMLPDLVRRHFLPGEGTSYDLTVVSGRDQQRIIYQSEESPLKSVASSSDASADMFSLRGEELRRMLRGNMRRGDSREVNRPSWRTGNGLGFVARGLWEGGQRGLWQVQIRHRAGSLEAAVDSVRRRNLVISFGILGLLGASVAMLIVSARRARRLAEQQMDFVAGVSHELRTPLAVIESAAYNLDKGVVKSPEQVRSYGSLIRKETGQLKIMVEQILEFAGEQSWRPQYILQAISINSMLDDVISSSQPLLAESGFQLECDIASDLPPALGDRAALARAIQNLIGNAMKYSGQSKWIGLSAKTIETESGRTVEIAVADRGMGIPDEELAKIFEPFYRGSAARAAQIHGNGLGLSLIKNIIAAHQGTIEVKSAPGAGSSFVISLPVTAAVEPNNNKTATVSGELSYE